MSGVEKLRNSKKENENNHKKNKIIDIFKLSFLIHILG